MTKSTKILSDEHKNILKIADALEKECDAIKQGKLIDKDFFIKAIYFIRNYADRFHHAKEGDKENDKRKSVENAIGYVQLIREHIYKEDNILYPMADEVLDKKTQQNMLKKFEKEEKAKEKDKKKCLAIIKEFEKRK